MNNDIRLQSQLERTTAPTSGVLCALFLGASTVITPGGPSLRSVRDASQSVEMRPFAILNKGAFATFDLGHSTRLQPTDESMHIAEPDTDFAISWGDDLDVFLPGPRIKVKFKVIRYEQAFPRADMERFD